MADPLSRRLWPTTKASNGDQFIMEVLDKQVTITSYEGTDIFYIHALPGIRTLYLRCKSWLF